MGNSNNEINGSVYKKILEAMLEEDWIFVVIDCSFKNVEVPPHLKNVITKLQIGYDMPNQIPDLKITEKGFSCTLSFMGTRSFCSVPWEACMQFIGTHNICPVVLFDLTEKVTDKLEEAVKEEPKIDNKKVTDLSSRRNLRKVK